MSTVLPTFNSTIVRKFIALARIRGSLAVARLRGAEHAVERATRLFLTPPRHAHREREIAFLAKGERFVVDSAGGCIAAWRYGDRDKPAVLFSHGWGGRGAQGAAFVEAALEAGFQAVVFDHEGHGFSEGRESSLVAFSRGLSAVADSLAARGVRIAGVVGHSLGAAAIAHWLSRGGRSDRVVLVAPPSSLIGYSGRFARLFGLPERVRHGMQLRIERHFGVAWSAFELPGSVADLSTPALVIHDAKDRDVPIANGLAFARAWPDARFSGTNGLGHNAILRNAGVARDALDFIRGEVVFAPPPKPDAWSAFPGPAPLL
jgi:pimeloyl-ACP methyl ester carboxylesterase